MPIEPIKKGGGSGRGRYSRGKLKKGRSGGFVSRFKDDLIDIGTGIPAGLVMTARAVDEALPAGPIKRLEGKGKHGDPTKIKAIGRAQIEALKDLKRGEAWSQRPASNLLTALGIASLGAGTVVRGAAGASAAAKGGSFVRGATAPVRTSRKMQIPAGLEFKGQPKKVTVRVGSRAVKKKDAEGKMIPVKRKGKEVRTGGRLEERTLRKNVPDSLRSQPSNMIEQNVMSPLALLLRKATLDPMYKASLKRSNAGKRGGGYARRQANRALAQRERFAKQAQGAKAPEIKRSENIAERSARDDALMEDLIKGPLNALRTTMWLRPRYLTQNLGGTGMMLAAQQPLSLGKSSRRGRAIKQSDPDVYETLKAAQGYTGGMSGTIGAGGAMTQKVNQLGEFVNRPEAAMRVPAIVRELELLGIRTPEQMRALFANPYSNKAQLAMQRSNEAVADYSRLGRRENTAMRSNIPIFYPMTKAFTRYGARFPLSHPYLTAALASIGEQGKEYQAEGFGGRPPWWMQYSVPDSMGDTDLTNPQNIYPFSPGVDVLREASGMVERGGPFMGTNVAQHIGPLADILYAAGTGRDITTGWPMREENLYKAGGAVRGALTNSAPGITPFSEFWRRFIPEDAPLVGDLNPGDKGTFEPMSLLEALAQSTIGPWAVPRRYKKKQLTKQIKSDQRSRERRAKTARKYGG